mmetsp:Transcript_22154/g.46077  ORF Transcript_22154/g.46077 Transcript_22154/m.46077 type:complete len:239 (+) Transcript_22154:74-790(+)
MSTFTQSQEQAAFNEFSAGVTATLRRWSALRAAVDGEWGGIDSHKKAESLRQGLIGMFFGPQARKNVEPLDIEDALYIHMEEEFSCQLEDGSPNDLAGIIFEMARRCVVGDFALSRQMVDFAEAEKAALQKHSPPTVMVEGEMDDDDDDENDMMEDSFATGTNNATTTTTTTVTTDYASYAEGNLFAGGPTQVPQANLPPARQLGEAAPEKPAPVLDDDGFEAVVPRRSRRKNKGQMS